MTINQTFLAGAALAENVRVKLKAGSTTTPLEVVAAGAGEQAIGMTVGAAAAGKPIAVAKLALGWLPILLVSLRELTTGAVPNAAGNGGLLASDTTPILNTANGDTDGCLQVTWAASNSDAIGFQIPLPPDSAGGDVVIRFRAKMGGATDTPVISADSYFDEGDTKVEDDSAAVTGTTWTEYAITIAAADVPDNARTLSVELTPGAHTTDTLALSALWVEYEKLGLAQ
jgi:hypothetical protein